MKKSSKLGGGARMKFSNPGREVDTMFSHGGDGSSAPFPNPAGSNSSLTIALDDAAELGGDGWEWPRWCRAWLRWCSAWLTWKNGVAQCLQANRAGLSGHKTELSQLS